MSNERILALVLLVPFAILSTYAVAQVGYWGIFDYHRHSPAGWQVFADLVIALLLVMVWMVKDARKCGRNVWPYLLVTLFLGSFGPLLYLVIGATGKEFALDGA